MKRDKNINVRATAQTVQTLETLSKVYNVSQADIVQRTIAFYDYMTFEVESFRDDEKKFFEFN